MQHHDYTPSEETFRVYVSNLNRFPEIERIERIEERSAPRDATQAAVDHAGLSSEIPVDQLMAGLEND